jgi:hypothetical protein
MIPIPPIGEIVASGSHPYVLDMNIESTAAIVGCV